MGSRNSGLNTRGATESSCECGSCVFVSVCPFKSWLPNAWLEFMFLSRLGKSFQWHRTTKTHCVGPRKGHCSLVVGQVTRSAESSTRGSLRNCSGFTSNPRKTNRSCDERHLQLMRASVRWPHRIGLQLIVTCQRL